MSYDLLYLISSLQSLTGLIFQNRGDETDATFTAADNRYTAADNHHTDYDNRYTVADNHHTAADNCYPAADNRYPATDTTDYQKGTSGEFDYPFSDHPSDDENIDPPDNRG